MTINRNKLFFQGGGVCTFWRKGVAIDEWMDSLGYRVAINMHIDQKTGRIKAERTFENLKQALEYIDQNY